MSFYGWRLNAGMESSQVFGAWITILRLVLFSYSKTQPCNSLVKVSTDVFVLINIIIVICLKLLIK